MSTDIKMIRGTSFQQPIHLTYDGKDYKLQPNEILRFGVKENVIHNKYLIRKEWTADEMSEGIFVLKIMPEDTINLPIKKYKYDIGLQRDDDYYKIIPESDFLICENITKWEEV